MRTRIPSLHLLAFMIVASIVLLACGQGDDIGAQGTVTALPGPTALPPTPSGALPEGNEPLVEPPPARLEIAGRAQVSGIGTYCWSQATGEGAGLSVCADMVGIPTALEPLVVTSPFTATFRLAPEEMPTRLLLDVMPVTAQDELRDWPAGSRGWRFSPGEALIVPLEREPALALSLEPGLYVLNLAGWWPTWGDASYGFLLEVQPSSESPAQAEGWQTYTQAAYGFSFRYPAEWQVEEGADGPNLLRLRYGDRPDWVLTVGFRRPGEQVPIQRRGLGAGELVSGGSIPFLDRAVSRELLIYEGRTKAVLYHNGQEIDVGGLILTLSLDDLSADYGTAQLTPEIQTQVDRIVESFARLPALVVDEVPVVAAAVDGPGHFEYTDRLGEQVLARIEGRRAYAAGQALARANASLAPFGYRLEAHFDAQWNRTFYDLLREGEAQPLLAGLSHVWPVSVNASGTDFVLVAENAPNVLPLYLQVQRGGIEPWDVDQSASLPPAYVGEALARVTFTGFPALLYQVELDGQVVYSGTAYAQGAYMPLQRLTTWEDHWALEVDDHLIVDGQDLGQALGYDAAFGLTLIRDQPFYFFEQGGQTRISYGGRVLPNVYDQVFHNQCCEASIHNVEILGNAILFHALWNGTWYLVEAGVYDGEMAGTYRYTAPEGWSFRYPMHWDRLDEELGFVQDTVTGKTLTFASSPTSQAELERWLDAEIDRKLAATEADNSLVEPLASRQTGALTVYCYAILSRLESSETVLRATVLFDGQRRYEFYAAIPPLAEDEYQAIIDSFVPAR